MDLVRIDENERGNRVEGDGRRIEWKEGNGRKRNEGRVTEKNGKRST